MVKSETIENNELKKQRYNLFFGVIVIFLCWIIFFLILYASYANDENETIRDNASGFAHLELLTYTPIITSICLCFITFILFLNYLRAVNSDNKKNVERVNTFKNNDIGENFLKSTGEYEKIEDNNDSPDDQFEKEINEDDDWNVDYN